jgi:hypothetical protein
MGILQLRRSSLLFTDSLTTDLESELLYDWRFTANQFTLAPSPLRLTTSIFFQMNTCGYNPYVTFSLTRGWVYRLHLLLALATAVILGYESRGTPHWPVINNIVYEVC